MRIASYTILSFPVALHRPISYHPTSDENSIVGTAQSSRKKKKEGRGAGTPQKVVEGNMHGYTAHVWLWKIIIV